MFNPHHVSHVTCHVLCVIGHGSRVMCHMSHVKCHVSYIYIFFYGGASQWRDCYQLGLPRLFFFQSYNAIETFKQTLEKQPFIAKRVLINSTSSFNNKTIKHPLK